MNRRINAASILMVGLLAACGNGTQSGTTSVVDAGTTTPSSTPATSTVTSDATTPTTAPDERDPSEQTVPIDPGLEPLITQAVADLSERLDISKSEVEVVGAELVTWPDTSLGCPQKGMQYAQVLTDGSLITLRHAGREYPYHTGGSTFVPFLCENGK